MKISVVVMAHEKRRDWFPYLKDILGNVPFVIDNDELQLGTWGNCRRAWSMVDKEADYGLVIQDDAILCKDFLDKAKQFISKHPDSIYQFFYGDRKSTKHIALEARTLQDGYIYSKRFMWGVAVAIPTDQIDRMIEYCDTLPEDMPDDTRIKHYCLKYDLDVFYPWPSLVEHRFSPSLVKGTKDLNRRALNYIDQVKIPKIFHQIWIGEKPEPRKWTNTWKHIPDYEYILWDKQKIDTLNLKNRDLYDHYMKIKNYPGAADVARIEILEAYGGVYVDADTKLLRKWRDFHFLDFDLFVTQSNTKPSNHYRISNGIMGATPHNQILQQYIREMGEAEEVVPPWNTIGGTLLTKIILEHIHEPNISVLEPYWFYPVNSRGIQSDYHEHAIAKHFWGSTRRKNTGSYDY